MFTFTLTSPGDLLGAIEYVPNSPRYGKRRLVIFYPGYLR